MYCKNCGKQISENAKYCNYCGYQVEEVKDDENQVELVEQPTKKKKLNGFSLASIITGVYSINNAVVGIGINFIYDIISSYGYYIDKSEFGTNSLLALIAGASAVALGIVGLVQCQKQKGFNRVFAIVGVVSGSIGLMIAIISFIQTITIHYYV